MANKINNTILYFLIIFSIYCSLKIGISWDELIHIDRGNERLKYILSFGSYDYLDYGDQRFYPGFYNTLAVFITKIFPKKYEIESLHLINNLFSIFTILGIYKISAELFNKNVGKIVLVLCFFNPIFFGHMAINQKDMIVAFSNIWATYLIIRYLKNQSVDEKRNRYVILGGLVIGLGLGVRIVFLSTLIPIIIISFFDILVSKRMIDKTFSNKKLLFDTFKILIIAYLLMVSCWPDTHKNIFVLPLELFMESFNEIIGIPLGLLNGNFYSTSETPKSYLLLNFLYKLPEFVLLSYVIFIYLIFSGWTFFNLRFKFFDIKIILILLIILFPNLLLLISPYKIYDGLRFFLYLIPFVCIIPGLTIYYLLANYKLNINKILITTVFCFFTYHFLIFFTLTPYQYTYLNFLNGDFSKAHEKFENDYWTVSLKELVNQIPDNKDLLNNNELKLAFCGVSDDNVKFYLKKIKNFQFQQVNSLEEDYDYIIMTNRVLGNAKNKVDASTNNSSLIKTCFDKFKGVDVITVNRNGLVLSTLRKKI